MNGPPVDAHRRQLEGITMRARETPDLGTRDHSDAIVVTRRPVCGPPRRERYEPRADGRWTRVEEVWVGDACGWRHVGSEVVKDVGVEEGA